MRKITMVPVALLFLICVTRIAHPDAAAEEAAIKAAQSWLELVDAAKYEESWEEASQLFKDAISKEDWIKTIKGINTPLGKVLKRTLKSKEYTTTLQGAPDGEYVVIQYDTSFENKKAAVETITPMLEKDGKWRVAGYYVRY